MLPIASADYREKNHPFSRGDINIFGKSLRLHIRTGHHPASANNHKTHHETVEVAKEEVVPVVEHSV